MGHTNSNLPSGVARGPNGEFVSADDMDRFEAVEYATGSVKITADAADTGAGANELGNYEGVQVLDIDEIVDRHEIAHLLYFDAVHGVIGANNVTSQVTVNSAAELSASPSEAALVDPKDAKEEIDDFESNTSSGTFSSLNQSVDVTDDADNIGRPMLANWSNSYEDDANGNGGPGSAEFDRVTQFAPGQWDFDRRDELYQNGWMTHYGDASPPFYAYTQFQMAFGIEQD